MEVVARPSVLVRARDVPDLWGPNAPLKLLVEPDAYRELIASWAARNYTIGGLLSIVAVVVLRLAYPNLRGFHPNWLLCLGLALTLCGLSARAVLLRSERTGMLLYAVVTAVLVPLYAAGAGPRLSTTVSQGCIVVAAATPIIFSRRKAMAILIASLAGTAAVFSFQLPRVMTIDRVVVIVAQTGLYTALMVWFSSALTRLAVAERKLRVEIEMSRAELAAVDTRRRNFLDKMGHELRTPLNAIIGFSETLRLGVAGGLSSRQSEYVTDICSSGRHLLDLVDDVLDVGMIEGGEDELALSRFPLERAVRDSVALCREEAARRHVLLSLTCDESAGAVTADQRKVKQILLNLIWNALKFTPANGAVAVSMRRSESGFVVTVADTGPGVDENDRERIFVAFEQGGTDKSDSHPAGTGLGLPLARRLARLHGGDLTLEEGPGGGAKFVLTLPAAAQSGETQLRKSAHQSLGWVGADDPGILDEGSALEWLVGPEGAGRYRARITGIAVVVEIIATGVVGALPQPKDFHLVAWPWLGIAVGLLGVVVTFHPRIRFTAKQLYRISLVSVPATGLYIWTVGPRLSAAMSTIIMMMGVAVFTAFRWKRAVVIGLEVGASYAVVLARQPDNNLSAARWFLTMGLMTSGALIARWLLQFLPGLVASEKEVRREAELANAQLATASSHKSEFLANMSHELRTPLNAIIGFADVLKQDFFGKLNRKQAEYVDDIESAGRHLLAVINDILDLAKAEAGRLDLSVSPCCLAELLDAGTVSARTAALGRGVDLRIEDDTAGDPVSSEEFQGDPQRLARAIASVVDNAVSFTPDGGQVTVTAQRSSEHIEIAVADSGPGIHPADHERIFAAFEHAGKRDQAGSGIGLALSRRLVQLHGGSLSVDSRPGQGSTFTFLLPARRSNPDPGDAMEPSASEASTAAGV